MNFKQDPQSFLFSRFDLEMEGVYVPKFFGINSSVPESIRHRVANAALARVYTHRGQKRIRRRASLSSLVDTRLQIKVFRAPEKSSTSEVTFWKNDHENVQ